jgi:hypothetical protein
MSMFNWQAATQSGSSSTTDGVRVIVQSFWIYWAVSIPLTLIVLLGWRIWWHYQKSYYAHQYPHIIQKPDAELVNIGTGGLRMPFSSTGKTRVTDKILG